jgi:hypothetical protein
MLGLSDCPGPERDVMIVETSFEGSKRGYAPSRHVPKKTAGGDEEAGDVESDGLLGGLKGTAIDRTAGSLLAELRFVDVFLWFVAT